MTEESPFYGMVYWYTGRYGKNVERKMTVFFDKINKSILFVPKMKMDTTLAIDGEKISESVRQHPGQEAHQILLQPRRLHQGLPVHRRVGVPRTQRLQMEHRTEEGRCFHLELGW